MNQLKKRWQLRQQHAHQRQLQQQRFAAIAAAETVQCDLTATETWPKNYFHWELQGEVITFWLTP